MMARTFTDAEKRKIAMYLAEIALQDDHLRFSTVTRADGTAWVEIDMSHEADLTAEEVAEALGEG